MPSVATCKLAPRRQSHRLRLGMRLAAGVSVPRVAAAEGMAEAELRAMLADPDFAGLIEAVQELEAMPAPQLLARLQKLAMQVLEWALVDGDIRACLFVLTELRQGRNPAETLADAALRKVREGGRLPPQPTMPPEPRLPAVSPPNPNRWAGAAAARLKQQVIAEHVLRRPSAAAAPTAEPAAGPVAGRAVRRRSCERRACRNRRKPAGAGPPQVGLDRAAQPGRARRSPPSPQHSCGLGHQRDQPPAPCPTRAVTRGGPRAEGQEAFSPFGL